tara:strand:+ start:467 stop:649 length:183 start_codon:yes stop_codon:yes gene_type:complete
MTEKCTQCQQNVGPIFYQPMPDWKIKGPLCSGCYSEKIKEFYPGTHVRLNLEEGDEEEKI